MAKSAKDNSPSSSAAGDPVDAAEETSIGTWLLRVTALVVCLILLLSLLPGSYDPQDWEILVGGIGSSAYPSNWVGMVGVALSHWALLLFGFAAYPVVILLFLSALRRLVWRRGVRPVRWDYWMGLLLIMLGGAMLLGIWPGLWSEWAYALNLAELPGGVIGQRLCAPASGLMRIILNAAGSAIVSSALLTSGLIVVWIHDWHDLVRGLGFVHLPRRKAREQSPAAEEHAAARPEESSVVTRRRRRQEARNVQQPELQLAGTSEGALPEPLDDAAPASGGGAAAKAPRSSAGSRRKRPAYALPPLALLSSDVGDQTCGDPKEVEEKKAILQETLDSFGIDATVGHATSGPRVTLYEVVPAAGVKVEKISRLSNNICMDLRATSIRILTPIPGRKSVGIEVPNSKASAVSVRSLMESPTWSSTKACIPLLLGRSISGEVVILDLAKAPHLLIAGATGSGKSVCINLLIMSLLYRFSPDDLRLIMVDPKVVEFRAYETLPHLITPVISKVEKVPLALRWVLREMERRYRVLAKVGARNLEGFNGRRKTKEEVLDDEGNPIPDKMPYIVVVIDELADIMMTAKGDVETALTRLAQMSRAVGIHAILATQRPSVNVITGTIKANFPTRIAFKVTSQVDSRTILDTKGAEALLGQGDMLFRPPGASGLQRNQGGMVEDDEIEAVVEKVAEQWEQDFDTSVLKGSDDGAPATPGEALTSEDESLVEQAVEIILRDQRATTSYLQRCMRIGYNRAAMIIDILEERGIIGPQVGSSPREILIAGDSKDDEPDDESAAEEDVDASPDEESEEA